MDKLVWLILLILFLSMVPSKVWTVLSYIFVYGILGIIGLIVFLVFWAFFGKKEASQKNKSCGTSLSLSSTSRSESTKIEKEKPVQSQNQWPFAEKVEIKNGEIRTKGVLETGLLSRKIGETEERGGPLERHRTVIFKEGILGREEVGEIRSGFWSTKVYDKKGNEIGEVREGIMGKHIVDKNGKVIAEIKD